MSSLVQVGWILMEAAVRLTGYIDQWRPLFACQSNGTPTPTGLPPRQRQCATQKQPPPPIHTWRLHWGGEGVGSKADDGTDRFLSGTVTRGRGSKYHNFCRHHFRMATPPHPLDRAVFWADRPSAERAESPCKSCSTPTGATISSLSVWYKRRIPLAVITLTLFHRQSKSQQIIDHEELLCSGEKSVKT